MQRKSSFTGLLITALCAVASGKLREYHYVSEEKTWSEAQQYCREHYTDLAFISNQEEVDQLLPISRGDWTWIGLHRDVNDPTGWTWSGGENSAFRFWKSGEPNNAGGIEDCVMVQWDMGWMDSRCSRTLPFLCYKEKLILVQEMKTWEEALEYCRDHYTDLPSLLSKTEHLQAQSKMEGAQTDHVWTGLIFLAREWLWVNGDHLEYQAWSGGELPHCPAQYLHCGTLTRDEKHWGTRNCKERRNFLCYRA
ncbi:macrophage mannose receptor 1-like [Oncorhynchus masou masou]|uniref:macrophage mannose receptor 1-like n=1 Tax=Oncorhynchus masou masou TaxID=90313 RepID=UPI00318332F6